MKIEGSAVLVSGGGSGLGAATARYLAERGARVAVLDRDGAAAAAVASELDGVAVTADVGVASEVEAAVARAVDGLGTAPRIVLNCAGIATAARVVGREGRLGVEVFERVVRVNLIGTYNVMSYAAQRMAALDPLETGERGVIVNTASVAWQDGQVGQTAYAASKGGIAALSLPAARDFAGMGIRVMAIAPGLFRTPMMEGLPPETTEAIVANIPFPDRLGDPDEFAHLAAHIVENAYLNGTTLRLDGAVRLPRK